MADLQAPGYSRYPGQIGISRRNNAAAIVRGGRPAAAYAHAVRILMYDFGYTLDDIAALRPGA